MGGRARALLLQRITSVCKMRDTGYSDQLTAMQQIGPRMAILSTATDTIIHMLHKCKRSNTLELSALASDQRVMFAVDAKNSSTRSRLVLLCRRCG